MSLRQGWFTTCCGCGKVPTRINNSFPSSTLKFASAELREDRDFVLEAVKQSGWALKHASPGLQEDWEIVLASYGVTMQSIGMFAATATAMAAVGMASGMLQSGQGDDDNMTMFSP